MRLLKHAISVIILFISSNTAFASTDPMINQWLFFDGISTYYLNIKSNHAGGYSISYTHLFGSGSNDVCSLVSDDSFTCMGGESVTLDAKNHRVILKDYGETNIYYDKAYQPESDAMLGEWGMTRKDDVFGINIIKKSTGEYLVSSSYRSHLGYCEGDRPEVYAQTIKPDGSVLLSKPGKYHHEKLQFNPKSMEIVNPAPGSIFQVGSCIYTMDMGDILFKKKGA